MLKWILLLMTGCGLAANLPAQEARTLYENDFSKAAVGGVPDDFLVLDGQFAVKEEGGNKFLELPGAPLDTFAVLFGPTEKENLAASARFFGTSKGRRYPTFAIGLNGQGAAAYRLQVSPAKNSLELYKGDQVKVAVPYEWPSGKWTRLRFQIHEKRGGEWIVAGKAWTEGEKEPVAWSVSFDEKEAPIAGKASIWGSPFSGQPIRFDDLKVTNVAD